MDSAPWFVYLLDDQLLEKNKQKFITNKLEAVELISLFLHHADLLSVVPKEVVNGGDNREESVVNTESNKICKLRFMAVKLALLLDWDFLNKNLSLGKMHELMLSLVNICSVNNQPIGIKLNEPISIKSQEPISNQNDSTYTYDFSKLEPQEFFALSLYHSWCLNVCNNVNIPSKPLKPKSQIPGYVDPMAQCSHTKEQIIKMLKDNEVSSMVFIEALSKHLTQHHISFISPSFCSINLNLAHNTNDDDDDAIVNSAKNDEKLHHDWSSGTNIPQSEIAYQLHWVLACHHLFKGDYEGALTIFNVCLQLMSQLDNAVFVKVDKPRLLACIKACQGMTAKTPSPATTTSATSSLYDKIHQSLQNNMKGLLNLMVEDLVLKQLTMPMRISLQNMASKDPELHQSLKLANEMRRLLDRRCVGVVSSHILSSKPALCSVLVKICSEVMERLSDEERKYIKYYLLSLCLSNTTLYKCVCSSPLHPLLFMHESHLLTPSESPASSSSTSLLTAEEMNELLYIDGASDEAKAHNLGVNLERSMEVGKLYELATLVHKNFWSNRNYVSAFFEKWRLPNDIFMCLNSIHQLHHISILVHVVLCKARSLLLTKQCEKARLMLVDLDKTIRSNNLKLNKLLSLELLRCYLVQYYTGQLPSNEEEMVVTKCKQSMTYNPQDADVRPNSDLMSLAIIFLIDFSCWDFVASINHDNDPVITLLQQLSSLLKEKGMLARCRVAAKSLIDNFALMFPAPETAKKAKLAIMTSDGFSNLLLKIKNPSILSILISCLSKLLKLSDLDMNEEVHHEHTLYWPSSLNNTKVDRDQVLEVLQRLLRHALYIQPNNTSWLRTRAELAYYLRDYRGCLCDMLHTMVVASDYFAREVEEEGVNTKMIQASMHLHFYTIAAVMCQYQKEVDYGLCFKCLQEQTPHDGMDFFYQFLYDTSILEFIINHHHKRGAIDRRNHAVGLMNQLDNNSHNRPQVVAGVVLKRKRDFYRAFSRLMLILHKTKFQPNDYSLYIKSLVV